MNEQETVPALTADRERRVEAVWMATYGICRQSENAGHRCLCDGDVAKCVAATKYARAGAAAVASLIRAGFIS